MSQSRFDIRINNDGQVVMTQTTTMTPEEYLTWAQQVYQFQVTLRGAPAPVVEKPPALDGQGSQTDERT